MQRCAAQPLVIRQHSGGIAVEIQERILTQGGQSLPLRPELERFLPREFVAASGRQFREQLLVRCYHYRPVEAGAGAPPAGLAQLPPPLR